MGATPLTSPSTKQQQEQQQQQQQHCQHIHFFDPTEGAFAPAAVREDKDIARLLNAAGCGGGVLIEEENALSSSISTPPPQPAAFNKRAIPLSSLTAAGAKAPSVGSKRLILGTACQWFEAGYEVQKSPSQGSGALSKQHHDCCAQRWRAYAYGGCLF